MKILCFAVHDSKAMAFIQPFFFPTREMATRMFKAAANDPQTNFGKFPGDYTLFELGTFDLGTGELTAYPTPNSLGLAIAHLNATTETQTDLPMGSVSQIKD